jgi:hypothetical protein
MSVAPDDYIIKRMSNSKIVLLQRTVLFRLLCSEKRQFLTVSGQPNGSILRVQESKRKPVEITTTPCVTTQKSTVLSSFAAKA